MNNEELTARLIDAHNALTEKLGKQPLSEPQITLRPSGKWDMWASCGVSGLDNILSRGHDTPEAAIDGGMAKIDAMPDPRDRALHEFQKMTAALIDFGNENQIDVKFLNPIIETARALAENAITDQSK